MKNIVTLALVLTVLVSIEAYAVDSEEKYVYEHDILYRTDVDTDYARSQCRLDVYRPKDKKDFPTMVFFHGGGLKEGTRESSRSFARRFSNEGIAVVLPTYRFSPKVKHPAYTEDAAAAVAWAFKNIARYGGSPKKIFVSGHSAGGYLTAMVGLDKRYLARHDIDTFQIAGLLPLCGQMITHSTVRNEQSVVDNRQTVGEFAPLYYAHVKIPPLISICAEYDYPLYQAQNVYFIEVLKNAGNTKVSYLELADRDHITLQDNPEDLEDPLAMAMLAFIRKYAPQE
jgi:acetyl esterase/lipase